MFPLKCSLVIYLFHPVLFSFLHSSINRWILIFSEGNDEVFDEAAVGDAPLPTDPVPSTSTADGVVDEDMSEDEAGDSGETGENDEDNYEDDVEEAEPQTEDGIPLSAIARLSDTDKAKLEVLRDASRKCNAKIEELRVHIVSNDEEEESLSLALGEYNIKSEKLLNAIISLCKLEEDGQEYAFVPGETEVRPFR